MFHWVCTFYGSIVIYDSGCSSYSVQNQPKDEAHLFPFIHPEKNVSDLGEFYQQIHEILVEVHSMSMKSQRSQKSINALVSLAQER